MSVRWSSAPFQDNIQKPHGCLPMSIHFIRSVRWILIFVSLVPFIAGAEPNNSPAGVDPNRAYRDGLKALQLAYRKSLAEQLPQADKVEVFLLDFEINNEKGKYSDEFMDP